MTEPNSAACAAWTITQACADGEDDLLQPGACDPKPARPVVTAAMVRAQAVRLVPTAAVGLAPKDTTLVNIQTIVWADAPKQQTLPTVALLGQRVVITLKLDHVAYDFGDGSTDADGPAGTAYSDAHPCRTKLCPGYYGHVYRHTGHRTVRATAQWAASYAVNGGAAQAVPGLVPGPQADAELAVKQAWGVLVPNP